MKFRHHIDERQLSSSYISQLGNMYENGIKMNQLRNLSATVSIAFGIALLGASPSNAILPAETGSSGRVDSSNQQSNIGLTIGHAIERVASTVSQIVSPQPADSAIAQNSYSAATELVCRSTLAYVLSYTPVLRWTYQNNEYLPFLTSLIVSTPIETRICS